MSATGTNTSTQVRLPLVSCVINQRLLQAVPNRTLSQLVDVMNSGLILSLLNGTEMWPPYSPDLNPVDYAIWSVIQLGAAGNILRVHYNSIKCDVSFSLGCR